MDNTTLIIIVVLILALLFFGFSIMNSNSSGNAVKSYSSQPQSYGGGCGRWFWIRRKMEFFCTICNKKFNSKESLNQHNSMKHIIGKEQEKETGEKKGKNKKYLLFAVLIIAVALIVIGFYIRSNKAGNYDTFAKCLSEKNVIVYGNDFCQYTGKQLNMFGNSEKYLKYVKCANNKELCDNKQIKITPTWEINGKMYEGVQSIEKLAEMSGCAL